MSRVALAFSGITKDYRIGWSGLRVRALNAFSLELRPGKILGLLGANGSGKSTALKIAAGIVRPDRGACRVFGKPAGTVEAGALLGYQPELNGVCGHLTAAESLVYWGRLAGVKRAEVDERAGVVMAQLDLSAVSARRVATFSKGMKQRLAVGQALMARPRLLLLDEPFSGLDPLVARSLSRLLRGLADEGTAILFTSHLLSKVEGLCDEVGLMDRGTLLSRERVDALAPEAGGESCRWDERFIALVEAAEQRTEDEQNRT